jgi:hypothetical protein
MSVVLPWQDQQGLPCYANVPARMVVWQVSLAGLVNSLGAPVQSRWRIGTATLFHLSQHETSIDNVMADIFTTFNIIQNMPSVNGLKRLFAFIFVFSCSAFVISSGKLPWIIDRRSAIPEKGCVEDKYVGICDTNMLYRC